DFSLSLYKPIGSAFYHSSFAPEHVKVLADLSCRCDEMCQRWRHFFPGTCLEPAVGIHPNVRGRQDLQSSEEHGYNLVLPRHPRRVDIVDAWADALIVASVAKHAKQLPT